MDAAEEPTNDAPLRPLARGPLATGVKPLAIAFAAGLISACGFAPIGWWPLTLVAFACFLADVRAAPHLRSALVRGWWFGVGSFTLGLNWIATAFTYQAAMPAWLGWIAVVLLSLYLAVYPAVAAGLAWRWGRASLPVFVLLFAAAWIVTEWLRGTLFTGFAWNPAGVALLPTFVSRLATLVGTYGLSGIALLLAGALLLLAERRWPAVAAIALPPILLGLLLAALAKPALDTSVTLRIVQPNIGEAEKWKPEQIASNMRRLVDLSQRPGPPPQLVLWPEAAVTRPLENGLADRGFQIEAQYLRQSLGAVAGPGSLLLTGGVTWRSKNGIDVSSATNSVFALEGSGRILARYDKAHLVPYGEYLPMRPILSRLGLSRLAPGDVDFDSGPGPRSLDLPIVGRVGLQVCYEMIFSGEVVDRGHRPKFIFNPSNDAWFGRWGPPQHLAQARLRALEEGLPVLRATPTGISAVIDADGRLLQSLPWRTAGAIDARLPAPKPPTLFARFGNLLPFLFALLLAATAIAVRRARR
ncbi:MAG TPA: apolipoprotein N-acyltransferase [Allosphingosinicella sp.]|jgi:apolipoprotein N-acyltransferase|nr:apolipoprotein N-acyltransferase [Allosphingosinicella sp.]